jgi:hypothetical protein
MTIRSRKPLIAAVALMAALSAPLAFAQSASPAPAQDAAATPADAATVPALGQVFEQADSNADGALTTDEYKAYVAKAQTAPKAGRGG